MTDFKLTSNSNINFDEAIGDLIKKGVEEKMREVSDFYGCHYLASGLKKTKTANKKRLIMSDNYGNKYDIDGVIANERVQPLILFGSKYIRYKKHYRDKGSWICTAHSAVRRRYHSIRSSIAVLAGSWSLSSQTMMTSIDINLFLIPFNLICELLAEFEIDFNWGEKEKEKSKEAWHRYNGLSDVEKLSIGKKMIEPIEENLISLIEKILDDSVERSIEKIVVEIVSNLGEVKVFDFDKVQDALDFIGQDELKELFLITDSFSLFDPPPVFED